MGFWREDRPQALIWVRLKMKCAVMGIGDCTMDLLAQVDDSFIETHAAGHRGGDLYCTSKELDRVLSILERCVKVVPGGSAANTIRALSHLGVQCAFLGAVGQDEWGDRFRENFVGLGVEARLKIAPFTSRVLCLISPDGERTFLVDNPSIEGWFASKNDLLGVKWIHLEARSLTGDRESVEEALTLARELGIPFSIDLSSVEIVKEYKDCLTRLIRSAELVFCNEDEIYVLTGLKREEGCFHLQQMCPVGVVTLGEKGCLVGSKGSVEAVSAHPVQAIDTTGAGDYFAAGFLYGYFKNRSLRECGGIGNRLGGAIAGVVGTALPREKWKELDRF